MSLEVPGDITMTTNPVDIDMVGGLEVLESIVGDRTKWVVEEWCSSEEYSLRVSRIR